MCSLLSIAFPETMSLEPPPPNAYMTRDELLAAVRSWAAAHGYATTIARSFPKRGYVYIGCDRAGDLKNCHHVTNNNRRRFRSSKRDRCQFSAIGSCKDRVWSLQVRNSEHNHRASSAEGHSSLRRLDDEEKNAVEGLIAAGVKSRNIKASIVQARQNSDRRPLRTRDIYNFRYKKERGSCWAAKPRCSFCFSSSIEMTLSGSTELMLIVM